MTNPLRGAQLALLLSQLVQLPVDNDDLLRFHDGDEPAAYTHQQAALRRALSSWRAATLDAGADAFAADLALERLEADLAALDKLLGDPIGQDRAALFQALVTPQKEGSE